MTPASRQTKRAWAGAGIILLLVIIGGFVFLLDDILARLRPTYTLQAVLREAPTIAPGSRVWVSGRDVGEVLTVGLLPSGRDTAGRVAVRLQLPTAVREQVRRDSRVRLTSERIVGESVLDIVGGTPAAPPLDTGDTLFQAVQYDAEAIAARARAFQLSLDSALADLAEVQAPLQARLAGFERVQRQLARAQAEYQALMGDVRGSPAMALLSEQGLDESLGRSRRTLEQLLAGVAELGERAEATGVTANAAALMATAGELRGRLAELDSTMRVRGGTIDRLARDSALVHAIAAARLALDSLIADAKRRPFRYVF